MDKKRLIFSIIAIPFGIFLFIYGGYDDSPGAQGLGLIAFITGIWLIITIRRNKYYEQPKNF
ncbi:MAG: hypothetical protein WC544_01855 [Patescibacteria group bacterium]